MTTASLPIHVRLAIAGQINGSNPVWHPTVAFVSWGKRTGRVESNPLGVIPKLDEDRDRRQIRRPLTEDELSRLWAVADTRGRREWYLTAALAGLRRSELRKLTWADVDSELGTITIRDGKAKREDMIPMHPQLADELRRIRPATVHPKVRVFPTEVTNETRLKDLLRAGLARRVVVMDADGKPVLVGKGDGQRPKTRIVLEDDEGRVIDRHALRTTLGTKFPARASPHKLPSESCDTPSTRLR